MHATTEQADSTGPHDEAAAEGTEGSEGELRGAHQSEDQLPGDLSICLLSVYLHIYLPVCVTVHFCVWYGIYSVTKSSRRMQCSLYSMSEASVLPCIISYHLFYPTMFNVILSVLPNHV